MSPTDNQQISVMFKIRKYVLMKCLMRIDEKIIIKKTQNVNIYYFKILFSSTFRITSLVSRNTLITF